MSFKNTSSLLRMDNIGSRTVKSMGSVKNKNGRISKVKHVKQFNGNEGVKFSEAKIEDFTLPIKDHVANYDCEILTKDWNDSRTAQIFLTKIRKAFVYGLPGRVGHIILVFLVCFYIFNYLRITYGCVPARFKTYTESTTFLNGTTTTNIVETKKCDGPDPFDFVKDAENTYSRLLTWLLGVYVAVTARRFWRQVSNLPRFDNVCLLLNAVIWSEPNNQEDEVEISENMTVKQLKMTIVRWMMLSWTMALSSISPRLRRSFRDAKYYNDKRLLTKKEYYILKGAFSGDDGWLVRWNVPLTWASQTILHAVMNPKDVSASCIKEHKELLASIMKLQANLRTILNHTDFTTSRMLFQAMTVALYFFLLLGIFGGHSDVYGTYDEVSIATKLAAIFPWLQIMKFVLIFGWIFAAKDLQNPFGDDE